MNNGIAFNNALTPALTTLPIIALITPLIPPSSNSSLRNLANITRVSVTLLITGTNFLTSPLTMPLASCAIPDMSSVANPNTPNISFAPSISAVVTDGSANKL